VVETRIKNATHPQAQALHVRVRYAEAAAGVEDGALSDCLGRSFGISYERLCSQKKARGEIQEEAGVQLKWARRKDTNEKKEELRRNLNQS
jgi:hypothetical protein